MPDKVTFYCPNECGRRYLHKSSLSFHLKYECGVDPQFECDICGRRFTKHSAMKRHKGLKHKVISRWIIFILFYIFLNFSFLCQSIICCVPIRSKINVFVVWLLLVNLTCGVTKALREVRGTFSFNKTLKKCHRIQTRLRMRGSSLSNTTKLLYTGNNERILECWLEFGLCTLIVRGRSEFVFGRSMTTVALWNEGSNSLGKVSRREGLLVS